MTSRTTYNNPSHIQVLGKPYHYEMISDPKRVGVFKRAIQIACPGTTVLESGAATGRLTVMAAKVADHVYAVEIDPDIADVARHNIRRNGLEHKVTLIQDDIRNVNLAQIGGTRVPVGLGENLSTGFVAEAQGPILITSIDI